MSKTAQITRKQVFITYCITKCYSDPPMTARRVHGECRQRSFPGAAALRDARVLCRKHRLCAAYTTRTPPVELDSGYDLPSFMPCRGCRRFFCTGFGTGSNNGRTTMKARVRKKQGMSWSPAVARRLSKLRVVYGDAHRWEALRSRFPGSVTESAGARITYWNRRSGPETCMA